MKKILRLVVLAVASFALFSSGIASAFATTEPTLPSNQHLFAFDCDRNVDQLVEVSPTDGSVTLVGAAPAPGEFCTLSAQFNPVDKKVYFLHETAEYVGNSDVRQGYWLGTVNTTTGVMTKIADLSGDHIRPNQLMITNTGQAFVSSPGFLHSLNLRTAVVSTIGPEYSEFSAVGYSPVTDKMYAYVEGSNDAFIIDRVTGHSIGDSAHNVAVASAHDCPWDGQTGYRYLYSVSFDANGNPWFLNGGCDTELYVQDFATGTGIYRGQTHDLTHTLSSHAPYYDFEASAIFIATDVENAATALSNTGANSMQTVGLWVLASGAVSGGTLTLFLMGRRRVKK
jgi:hypothetical protein